MQFASTPGDQGRGKGVVVPGLYAFQGNFSNRGLWVPSTQSICDLYCICMLAREGHAAVPR